MCEVLRYLRWSLPISAQLEGLEEGVVPIEPMSTSYKIKVYTKEGKALQRTIKRLQLIHLSDGGLPS